MSAPAKTESAAVASADVITHVEEAAPDGHRGANPENTTKDKAALFLANVEDTSFTYEEEKAVLRRIDHRVLPLLLWAYFFQQLDKSTLSYVSIFGIIDDANLTGLQYSWLSSILYFAQLVTQPLAAFLLVKVPTGKLLASVIFLWGTSQTIMAACTDFASLAALRYLLGTFEAFIAPICVATTQMWWRRSEQTYSNSFWNAMNGVTAILGSLFTYGLGHIRSEALYRYQIVFMFCGLLTVIYSFIVLALMPDSPMEAKYLSQREKVIATERLRANQQGVTSRKWRWDHCREVVMDLKTYAWFIIIVTISIPSGGIGAFGSLIVLSFGFNEFTTILLKIPFGIIQVISIIGAAAIATRWQRKGFTIALVAMLPTAGTVILLTVPRDQKGVLLFGYYLISCLSSITPLIYAWHVQNTGGDTKRKCTSAVMFTGMCTGNIIGPLLYSSEDAPEYRSGLIANLAMFILTAMLGILITLLLVVLNKKHARQREAVGKNKNVVDESMMKKNQISTAKTVDHEDAQPTDIQDDKGFADTTDLKNEDFIYVY